MSAIEEVRRSGDGVTNTTHELYRQYGKQIYAYCFHRLRSKEEAEDAVQTTFMNAFRSLQRGASMQFEQAWLYKIAQNVCIARQESSSRRLRLEAPNDLELLQEIVPGRDGEDSLELMGIEDALEAMPENQRRAILLREWQGLSYREIGEELQLSQSAVEMLIFRARRALAGALEQPAEAKKSRVGRKVGSIGSIVAALKTLLTGGAAVKAVAVAAAAVAVVGESAQHTIVRHAAPSGMTRVHAVSVRARTAVDTASHMVAPPRQVRATRRVVTSSHLSAAAPVAALPAALVERRPRTAPAAKAPVVAPPPASTSAPEPAPAPAPASAPAAVPAAAPVAGPAATPPPTAAAPAPVAAAAAPVTPTPPARTDQGTKPRDPAPAPATAPPPAAADPQPGRGNDEGHGHGNGHEKDQGRGTVDPPILIVAMTPSPTPAPAPVPVPAPAVTTTANPPAAPTPPTLPTPPVTTAPTPPAVGLQPAHGNDDEHARGRAKQAP